MDISIVKEFITKLATKDLEEKIDIINEIKLLLHEVSPFKSEPVDCVLWVKNSDIYANDYNPNSVAPPEMDLLAHSIDSDGYTQPIVSWPTDQGNEVIDGFHRHRVGKENLAIRNKIHGYLPIVQIRKGCEDRKKRIASTIRHNRARGKHKVDAMSEIVVELKNRNWKNSRIAKELGMDEDEILRLCQITGLADLFSDQDFSKSWDVEGEITESDFEELSDNVATYGETVDNFRVVNTDDKDRVFHTYDKWECHKAGFYNTKIEGMTKEDCESVYYDILTNMDRFGKALDGVVSNWKYSCEHYLTNKSMNRIAWLGQAAVCYDSGVPSTFRGGWDLLNTEQQEEANKKALVHLNKWLVGNDMVEVTLEGAMSNGRQSDIY